MGAASQNQSPMLVLAGRAPALRWGMGSLQEIDHVPFVAPLTRYAATAQSAAAVGDRVDDALRAAVGAPSGRGVRRLPDGSRIRRGARPRRARRAERTAPRIRRADGADAGPGGGHAVRRAAAGDHGRHQRVVGRTPRTNCCTWRRRCEFRYSPTGWPAASSGLIDDLAFSRARSAALGRPTWRWSSVCRWTFGSVSARCSAHDTELIPWRTAASRTANTRRQ